MEAEEPARKEEEETGDVPAEAMLYCPVCNQRLSEHKCKLVCTRCGYYMSCADYY
ncbi:MAG: hypothetical protein IT167_31340 [Bryobacterales bacterium]|nr:hypothetical protein [Bryobacterales bacterium]